MLSLTGFCYRAFDDPQRGVNAPNFGIRILLLAE
jgi:hypothetical protein